VLLVITSGQRKPNRAEIPDDGRFIGKPHGAADLFTEVDDLMRKFVVRLFLSRKCDSRIFSSLRPPVHG
jgi:hypothetical protein